MAKIVIQHDTDPAIGIVLEQGGWTGPQGWHGRCTQCGWPMRQLSEDKAIASAKRHVDQHEAQVIGIDPYSVVRGS